MTDTPSKSSCAAATLSILLLLIAGCGPKTTVAVTPNAVTIHVNESAFLRASSTSEYDVHFFWKSADESVANVMGSGRGVAVWGVAPGTTTISAEGRHSEAIGKATITVEATAAPEPAVPDAPPTASWEPSAGLVSPKQSKHSSTEGRGGYQ